MSMTEGQLGLSGESGHIRQRMLKTAREEEKRKTNGCSEGGRGESCCDRRGW